MFLGWQPRVVLTRKICCITINENPKIKFCCRTQKTISKQVFPDHPTPTKRALWVQTTISKQENYSKISEIKLDFYI